MTTSGHCLDMFKRNSKEFLRRFVTVDETWIHQHERTVKTVDFTRQTCSKEGKNGPMDWKVPTFCSIRKIIFTDYLEKGRTITGQYYADLLGRFDVELMKKGPHLAKKKVHDNATNCCHPHPPSSPDFTPCRFFLFPNMTKWLGGKRFTSNEEVISATEVYFAEFDKPYFFDGLKMLEYRCTKCISQTSTASPALGQTI